MLKSVICDNWLQEMKETAASMPAGGFAEIGVYQGGSAQQLYDVAMAQCRDLHLFDTFTGIPCKSKCDRHNIGDFGDTNLDAIKAALPKAFFHVGMFPNTLTDDVKNIAFIHSDVDQYESQKAVNKFLWPRVVTGGMMMIDDYYLLDGIRQAVDEDFGKDLMLSPNQRARVVKA